MSRAPRARLRSALCAAALIGLTLAAYVRFLDAGFAGTDSLPLIETSRVLSWPDVLQQLRQPVMAGTAFTSGELIYRPVASLTFALDYLVWGAQPAGYHLTNVLFHLVTTLSVFGILRGLGLARWSSFLGAGVFALHPTVAAAVPVIARRDNLVAAAPFCLALVCLARALRGRALWWTGLAVVLFALALLSKEMAFGGAPLIPLFAFGAWYAARRTQVGDATPPASPASPLGAARDREVPTARLARPAWLSYVLAASIVLGVTAVAMFVLRFAVLGSLGGYAGTAVTRPDPQLYRHILVTFDRFLFWPFRDVFPAGNLAWLLAPAMLLAVLLVASALMPGRTGIPLAIGCLWLADFVVFYTVLKTFTGAWYLYFALPGAALIVAALLEWAVTTVRARRVSGPLVIGRSSAVVALAATSVFVAGTTWSSALAQPYAMWLVDGSVSTRYLGSVLDCARQAPDEAVLTFESVPDYLEFPDNVQTELLTPTLVYEHTLTSALRLFLPDRSYTVVVNGYTHLRSADHLSVACQPTRSGRHITTSS